MMTNSPSSTGKSRSVWMDNPDMPAFPPLEKNAEADVCIVGAGIAGLTTAYYLTQEKKTVIVVDDRRIGGGETESTTAHLASALDDRFTELTRIHGKELTKIAAESHRTAIDQMEEIIKRERISCDFARVDGYLFAASHAEEERQLLEKERDAALAVGMPGVTLVEHAPLAGDVTGPALLFPRQGQFHPRKYLHGLARAVVRNGGKIFCDTHVTDVMDEKTPGVRTRTNHHIRARSLVLATNAPIYDNVAIYGSQAPYRTYAMSFTIPAGAVPRALYWDTADPYHYARLAENDTLLIVGGEDHKTGQANDASLRFQRLEQWTRARFPQARDVVHRWSGQVMETADGLALIGSRPGTNASIYIATGDSGHGMTHGTIAGILLTDLILNRNNAWEEVYDPSRKRVKAAGSLLRENMNVAGQMAKHLTPAPTSADIETIAADSGRVVQKGLSKLAIYRDAAGKPHTFSAVCPHKGCIVAWNSLEKSWDCPCHGSRFAAHGQVLNGPSISDLKTVARS